MSSPPTESNQELRRCAEEQLILSEATNSETLTPADIQRLLHELQLQQMELEMLNEEFRQVTAERDEKDALLKTYHDLYELAPVGYFTIDHNGIIHTVNLTGTVLLGVERSRLINNRLDTFISDETRSTFYDFLEKVFTGNAKEICEVVFETEHHSPIHVQIDAVVTESRKNCRAVIIDITRRKQTEKELTEAALKLEALMAAVPVGISFSDDITCQRVTGNPAVLEQFNVSTADNLSASAPDADAPGRKVRFFLDGREITDAELPLQRAVSENKVIPPMELTVLMPNGKHWFAKASGAPVRDAQGSITGGIAVTEDITERKLAEQMLRENEERMRLVLKAASIATFELDLLTGEARWNLTMYELLGLQSENVQPGPETFFRFVHPEDLVMLQTCWEAALHTGKLDAEFRIVRADGEERWMAAKGEFVYESKAEVDVLKDHGKALRFLGINYDITLHKQSEELLRNSEERLRFHLDNSPMAIVEWDKDFIVTRWTGESERMFGWIAEEVVGKPLADLKIVFEDDIPIFENTIARLTTGDSRQVVVTNRNYTKHGDIRYCTWYNSVMPDPEGQMVSVLSKAVDITELKKFQEALSRSQKTLFELVERSPFGVYVVDAQFRIVQMNTISQNRAFKNVRPVIGRDFDEAIRILWPEPVATEIAGHFRHTLNSGQPFYSRDFINPRQDLEIVEAYEWELHRMMLPDGQYGVICYYYDSTKLRQAETALRESEKRYSALFANKINGVAHCRTITGEHGQPVDYVILEINEAYERIIGIKKADIEGRRITEVFPDIQKCAFDYIGMYGTIALCGGEIKFEEFFELTGQYLSIYAYSPSPGEFIVIFTDETERKQANVALEESEKKFRSMFEQSLDAVFMMGADGIVFMANTAACNMFGMTEAELREVGRSGVLDTNDPRLALMLEECQRTGRCFSELNCVREGGEIFPTEVSSVILQGDPSLSFVILRDISERKKTEEALRNMNEELERRVTERTKELAATIGHLQSEICERKLAEKKLLEETSERLQATEALYEKERMLIQQSRHAAMGEMIGNIAHQWRQPLNSLGLYTQSLSAFYGTPNFNKQFLDNSIAKSMEIIKHMSKTIDDFRDYFKPEKEKTDFYVIEAIKSTLSLLDGSFQNPKITIDLVAHNNSVINGYQNEFTQVILNILNNARDAIIEREIADARVVITIGRKNSCAVVTVEDNAGGIPDEHIGKIFDPYFTTKGPQIGTGIGLFMSKTIIEKNMGGSLTIRNTEAGAEFRIEVEHGAQN